MERATIKPNIGAQIPSLTKTAYMPIDPNARNVIHTDNYASDVGMRGALIGGSTLLSYIVEMLYNYFDDSWMYHGKIKVSFIGGGAINGDVLTVYGQVVALEPEEAGDRIVLDVWLENQMQDRVVVGQASCVLA